MKICMLNDDPLLIGGAPEHIRQISDILATKYKCQVDSVTPLSMDKNFSFLKFSQRIKYVFWICLFLMNSNYDIYHSHSFSTSLFLPLAKLRRRKIGITVHGLGVNLIGGGILNRTMLPIILSRLILMYWPFDFKLSASSIPGYITIGNGVNAADFNNLKRSRHETFNILCISRRDPIKGVKILEQAVKLVPNCTLNLVSGRKWTLSDFSNADCYVLPSLSEGLPIVLLEAMAAKLPVIATDVGDCRFLVEKSSSGYIVNPGSVDELAKAIEKMRGDRNREIMGLNGHNYVRTHYTWEKVAEKVIAAYRAP